MKRAQYILFCVLQTLLLSAQNMVSVRSVNNSIIPDMIADPSITEIDGVFYCYATTDGYNQGLAASGLPVVWTSKDLVSYQYACGYSQTSPLVPYIFPEIDGAIGMVVKKGPVFKLPVVVNS